MELDRKNMRKIYRIIAFAVILFLAVQNLQVFPMMFRWLLRMLMPLILGAAMAFALNVPMTWLEKTFFTKPWKRGDVIRRKGHRALSITLTLLIVIGILIGIFFLIIPELARSIGSLAGQIPTFAEQLQRWLNQLIAQNPGLKSLVGDMELNFEGLTETVTEWLSSASGEILSSGLQIVQRVVASISTFFLSLFLSIYMLAKKEYLGRQARSLLYVLMPERYADEVTRISAMTSITFSNFITGQVTEAIILGVLTYITNTLFRFPYALIISVIIGILALVPIFGAIIGAAAGAVLIAIVSPFQAILFLIVNALLQQFENNVIYPRTVGNSIGLPAMWVMIATILGGNFGGVVGILLSIPLFSVAYVLLRTFVNDRLKKLKIPYYKIKR